MDIFQLADLLGALRDREAVFGKVEWGTIRRPGRGEWPLTLVPLLAAMRRAVRREKAEKRRRIFVRRAAAGLRVSGLSVSAHKKNSRSGPDEHNDFVLLVQ